MIGIWYLKFTPITPFMDPVSAREAKDIKKNLEEA
jgi:hypothetical protein